MSDNIFGPTNQIRRVISPGVPHGWAITADWDTATLLAREGMSLMLSYMGAVEFSTNTYFMQAEIRATVGSSAGKHSPSPPSQRLILRGPQIHTVSRDRRTRRRRCDGTPRSRGRNRRRNARRSLPHSRDLDKVLHPSQRAYSTRSRISPQRIEHPASSGAGPSLRNNDAEGSWSLTLAAWVASLCNEKT